jgi:acyl-CoA thioester hydrolase
MIQFFGSAGRLASCRICARHYRCGYCRTAIPSGKGKTAMTDPSHRKGLRPRSSYKHFSAITTRWMDNDAYGHINNVVYYSFFDTVVNRYLIEGGFLDIGGGEVIGLVVETACRYAQPIAFPEAVTAGLRVAHIGNSSVRYEVGLFRGGEEGAAAEGHFVHVYVDRQSRRPAPLPEALRRLLRPLLADGQPGATGRYSS